MNAFKPRSELRESLAALNVQRSTFGVRPPASCHSRSGSTLLVTLGILTVLSILAVAFYSVSRIQRQTAAIRQHRDTTRNQLSEALSVAMRAVDDAFCYTNFTSEAIPASANGIVPQRLAPVGHWFSQEWQDSRGHLSEEFSFQSTGLLTSPVSNHTANLQAAWSVNLLTPEVLARVPPALTNGLSLSPAYSPRFRSGWEISDPPAFKHNGTRIAYAVLDVSGFVDANYFISGPTTQQIPRVCFGQSDVTNWLTFALGQLPEGARTDLLTYFDSVPEESPFSVLSYDPDPDLDPFDPQTAEAHPLLGYASFAHSHRRKFDINSITNMIGTADSGSGDWLASAALMGDWLRPVYTALERANASESATQPDKLTAFQMVSVPWNILNFIDADRVPQLSLFANLPDDVERIATRANLAVEDVPLINKVTVFNIFGGQNGNQDPEPPEGHDYTYYDVDSTLSNHYAVAVELWYPFVPNPLPSNTAFYAVLSTNAADTATTTNRPLTTAETEDWFRWNEAASSNTVMQTLFYAWANAYTNAVGPSIWQHPLWQIITADSEEWFTTNMVNHPSWPVPGADGTITITNTPIWNAFYPDTYDVVTTNADGTVSTNVYTYMTSTNTWLYWVDESDGSTNRLVEVLHDGTGTTPPYASLVWESLADNTLVTNIFGAFNDTSDDPTVFYSPKTPGETNHLVDVQLSDGVISVVVSNGLTGAVTTQNASSFVLASWPPDGAPDFSIQTNLTAITEIEPIQPLPMPDELGETLAALFGILLAPDLSLDTSDELYDFLMRLPSDFGWWDFLGTYLAQYPFVQQTLMPSVSRPRTDNLFQEDRIDLTDSSSPDPLFLGTDYEGEQVAEILGTDAETREDSFGTYITIYPRKTVCFPEVTAPTADSGGTTETEAVATTNYFAIGSKSDYVLYFRPVVTLDDREGLSRTATPVDGGAFPVDVLDEALLTRGNGGNVTPFHSVTNICVADPRHNAHIDCWRGFPSMDYPLDPPDWEEAIGTTNLSTEVTEYPFIHLNAPFTSIGDIGHVYTSPDRLNLMRFGNASQALWQGDRSQPLHDTVSFACRSGAALLDLFTAHASPTNLPPGQTGYPMRGLVQANTPHDTAIRMLFADAQLGWTNQLGDTGLLMQPYPEDLSLAYRDALTNAAPAGIGWRSFADMLPSIATNAILRENQWIEDFDEASPAHDWIEDALRGLPDRVSFRQNIFVIVVAAQTLSPVSTVARPVVLADQRAAVTVIRDAFTGRWIIHDWRWLSQ